MSTPMYLRTKRHGTRSVRRIPDFMQFRAGRFSFGKKVKRYWRLKRILNRATLPAQRKNRLADFFGRAKPLFNMLNRIRAARHKQWWESLPDGCRSGRHNWSDDGEWCLDCGKTMWAFASECE